MDRVLRTFGTLALCVATATGVFAAGEDSRQLQNYRLTDLEGEPHSLGERRGEVVVVNFWASWCAPCLKELPTLDAWHAEWQGRGASVAAISVDHDQRKARRFVEKKGLDLDVYHDGPEGLARELDLPSLPCTYVLDQDGNVALVSQGASDEDLERVRRTVEGLIGTSASAASSSNDGGAR